MPRPGVGNPGNKGNTTKGPREGRRSAYQELADAEELYNMFFGEHNPEELQTKIKSKKFSVKTMMLFKALAGNERDRIEMFKKVFPDLQNVQTNAEDIREVSERIRAILEKKPHAKKK